MGCKQEMNPNFLGVCREKYNELRLLYLDPKGICNVETSIISDTLVLNIRVSDDAKQEFHNVKIPESIKYIKYGNVVKEVDKIGTCTATPRSGDEAIEYLKSLEK